MEVKQYGTFTPRALLELATPNTWGASVIPVLLGTALAFTLDGAFRPLNFILMLFAAVAMHCAVNAFNHGFDGLSGDDTIENCLDPHDAPVVYYQLNPKHVILLGIGYLALAFIPGLCLVILTGPTLLIIGAIGAAVTFLYAGGPLPITHLPFGELTAGFTMGGLITLAAHFTMTGTLHLIILLYALPMIIAIGMVLLLNNVCDIEKDIPAGRKTLPILIGRPGSTLLLRAGYTAVLVLIVFLGFFRFQAPLWLLLISVAVAIPRLIKLYSMTFTAETRMQGMKTVLPLTPLLGGCYTLIVLISAWLA